MTVIEQAIRDTGLAEDFNTKTGDCTSIALALRDVFGGELVGVYAAEDATGPAHTAVRIDNALYDGDGRTSFATLYGLFVPHITEPEDTEARCRGVVTPDDDIYYSDETRAEVRERLRKAVPQRP